MEIRVANKLQLAQHILSKNSDVAFVPKNGHFKRLVELSAPIYFESRPVDEKLTPEEVDEAMRATFSSGDSYQKQLQAVADLYIKPLVKRTDMLRRKIIPFVKDMVEHADTLYSKLMVLEPDIREVEIPALYLDPRFEQHLKPHSTFSNVALKSISFRGGFNVRTEEEIMGLLQSGSTIVDDMVAEIVASYPKGWLNDVYNEYFVEGLEQTTNVSKNSTLYYIDKLTMCYFILSKMISANIIDGVDMKLEEYTRYITNLMNDVGGFVFTNLMQLKTRLQMGELVQGIDRKENIIYVYGAAYRNFLQNGGSVDALLGATLRTDLALAPVIIQRKQMLEEEYRKGHEQRVENMNRNVRDSIFRAFNQSFRYALEKAELETKLFLLSQGDTELAQMPNEMDIDNAIAMYAKQLDTTPALGAFDIYIHAILSAGLSRQYRFDGLYERIKLRSANMEPNIAAFYVMMDDLIDAILDTSIDIVVK